MKKTSFILLGLSFLTSSWAADNGKPIASVWVDQNNEVLDLSKCIEHDPKDADDEDKELAKNFSKAYECHVTFTTADGDTCVTEFNFLFAKKPKSNEGVFTVDGDDDDTELPETCGQKRYGVFGTVKKLLKTLTIQSVSQFWVEQDAKDPDFKGDVGSRTFTFK